MISEYDSELLDQIKAYLNDKSYPYAIMLDGVWGIGKTYFIKNVLMANLETEYKTKYVSLYGCDTKECIEEAIYNSILEDLMGVEAKIEEMATDKTYGDVAKRRKKMARIGVSFLKREMLHFVYDKWQGINNLSSDLKKAVIDNIDFDKYFLIVDNLERCSCRIDDILGVLNELVEFDEMKMLIVVNEKEISNICLSQNIEGKYAVAADKNIMVSTGDYQARGVGENNGMPPEQLRERAKFIFSDADTNRYKIIREKLIGHTITYLPNVSGVMHKIIQNSVSSEKLSAILDGQVGQYVRLMSHYKHTNFRTFQFFIGKIKYLYNACSRMKICNDKNKDWLMERVVEQGFYACLSYKVNVGYTERSSSSQFSLQVTLQFIDQYVFFGIYHPDKAKKELIAYCENHNEISFESNDPYVTLAKEYYKHDQAWVEDKTANVIDCLENNRYRVGQYGNLMLMLAKLKAAGVCLKYYDMALKIMQKNICDNNMSARKKIEIPNNDLPDSDKIRLMEDVDTLNIYLVVYGRKQSDYTFFEMLEQADWFKLLKSNLEKDANSAMRPPIFRYATADVWIKCFLNSNIENLAEFREFIMAYYPDYPVSQAMRLDAKDMKKISDNLKIAMEKAGKMDAIKELNLKWLIKLLSEKSEWATI